MVPGGNDGFRVGIESYQILFLGDDVMNESFKYADIRGSSLRSSYPVFPIGQSDHNLIAFHFDGVDVLPGNSLVADLDAFPADLNIAEGDGQTRFVGSDGPGQ